MSKTQTAPFSAPIVKNRPSLYLFILATLVAGAITTYRYTTPLTGVTDAGGALLTLVSEFVLFVLGLILLLIQARCARRAITTLAWIGLILCFIAELFLHGWTSAVVLAIAALGLIVYSFSGRSSRS